MFKLFLDLGFPKSKTEGKERNEIRRKKTKRKQENKRNRLHFTEDARVGDWMRSMEEEEIERGQRILDRKSVV